MEHELERTQDLPKFVARYLLKLDCFQQKLKRQDDGLVSLAGIALEPIDASTCLLHQAIEPILSFPDDPILLVAQLVWIHARGRLLMEELKR